MTRVLVFGTFDLFHKGHESLLRQAKKHGDELFVVVALDKTVLAVKGKAPSEKESIRAMNIEKSGLANKVVLGRPGDKYKVIEEISPDIICLGYDQQAFTEKLEEELKKRKIKAKIMRMKAFHPEKYKTSIILKQKVSIRHV